MDCCENIKIVINSPVVLSGETISLYNSLLESGYNLFDSNDSFYNDVCTIYTTENGTDATLIDRQNEIFSKNGNISMCQIGCDFELYNDTIKMSKCECEVQKNSTQKDVTEINFSGRLIYNSFLVVIKNSNFMILKCYKIAFDLNTIKSSIGRIIMSIIFFVFIILLFIYLVKDRTNLNKYINLILQYKSFNRKQKDKKKMNKENKRKEKIKRNKKNGKREIKEKSNIIKGKKERININKMKTMLDNTKIKAKKKDKIKENKIYKGKKPILQENRNLKNLVIQNPL